MNSTKVPKDISLSGCGNVIKFNTEFVRFENILHKKMYQEEKYNEKV